MSLCACCSASTPRSPSSWSLTSHPRAARRSSSLSRPSFGGGTTGRGTSQTSSSTQASSAGGTPQSVTCELSLCCQGGSRCSWARATFGHRARPVTSSTVSALHLATMCKPWIVTWVSLSVRASRCHMYSGSSCPWTSATGLRRSAATWASASTSLLVARARWASATRRRSGPLGPSTSASSAASAPACTMATRTLWTAFGPGIGVA
mmetsp:Transcript_22484/g.62402  ORF Transcript_22484/g.62402 Transcript_22484/m.62402 type:complete len:207 (-) Transcript_22484:1792-2412(-)